VVKLELKKVKCLGGSSAVTVYTLEGKGTVFIFGKIKAIDMIKKEIKAIHHLN